MPNSLIFCAFLALFFFSSCEDEAAIQKNKDETNRVSELEAQIVELNKELNGYLDINDGEKKTAYGDIDMTMSNALKAADERKLQLEREHIELMEEFAKYQKNYKIEQ